MILPSHDEYSTTIKNDDGKAVGTWGYMDERKELRPLLVIVGKEKRDALRVYYDDISPTMEAERSFQNRISHYKST